MEGREVWALLILLLVVLICLIFFVWVIDEEVTKYSGFWRD
ncbi:MAG: hypothetical protein QW540_04905 [Archaeoglobaceae archaeon]